MSCISEIMDAAKRAGIEILEDEAKEIKLPRPDFWGGYDLWIEEIELWKNRKNRFHDRLKFKRKISIENGKIDVEKRWDSVRIQP